MNQNCKADTDQSQYATEISEIQEFLAPHNPHVLSRYVRIRHIVKNPIEGWPEFQMPKHQIEMCILWFLDQAAITLTNHLVERFLKAALIYHNTDYQAPEENIVRKMESGSRAAIAKYDGIELSQAINTACTQNIIDKKDKQKLHMLRKTLRNPYSHAEQSAIHQNVKVALVGAMVDDDLNFTFQEECEVPVAAVMPVSGFAIQMHAEANSIPYFEYVIGLIRRTLPKIAPDSKVSNNTEHD